MNKTLKREEIVFRLNNAMQSPHISDKEKLAIATFAENCLIGSNTYKGYTVDSDETIATREMLLLHEFKALPIEERKELEVRTRRYF